MVADIGSQRPQTVARSLRAESAVVAATPNYVRGVAAAPNDTLYRYGHNQRHYLELIRAPQAWDVTTGSADITIAIVDTGVQPDHPDLARRLVAGYDFVGRDRAPADANGHGTWVAGLAAARTGSARAGS